ncbi:MAG TPA: S8 family serine peptidase [Candidatus Nanopelagicales bacterium]
MWTSRMAMHGAMPVRVAACAAALALLSVPGRASADGPQRTALLTLTDGTSLSQLAESVTALGGRVLQQLDVAESLLVELPHGAAVPAGAVEVPDVAMKVNGTRTTDTEAVLPDPTYRDSIKAAASAAGDGVTVALVDTGVNPKADGLADVTPISVPGVEGTGDAFGHGTFLAGIIGGRGTYKGVAPSASILDVKVADDAGSTSLSKVLSGLQAVAAHGDVDVVNIALSSETPLPPGFDPLARALERLWGMGVTVVVAAGNSGEEGWDTVGSPGNDPVVLTAGALDEHGTSARNDDSVAGFSSRGSKFAKEKPDLVAPGVSLVSTASEGSVASSEGTVVGGYMRGSGTSMAAAVTSGAVAAVLGEHDALTPNAVKALLTSTAYSSDTLQVADGAGAGGLDLGAALAAADDTPIDVKPGLGPKPAAGAWGPAEEDAAAWQVFSDAWDSGDFDAVQAAWTNLSWQTQQWASRMWMLAVLADSLGLSKDEFAARSWAARSWAFDGWLARSWAARSWAARSWAFDEWLARSWAARSWAARSWAARSWATDEWLARSWAARSWAARSWAARSWAARSWAARSWADDEWAARSWAARSWATSDWDARSWAARSWARPGTELGTAPGRADARSWA